MRTKKLQTPKTNRSDTLIFLHIPKAGGSTFENILWRLYSPKSIYRLPDVMEERVKAIDKLQQLEISDKQQIKVLTGIMDFGLHKYIPQKSTYVTILRDPVDRIISHYHFVRNTEEHHLYSKLNFKNIGLQDYLTNYPLEEMDNGQTRLISGMNTSDHTSQRMCTKADLEKAKQNLKERFAVFGILEKYDETLILTKRRLQWVYPTYVQQNIAKVKYTRNNIPSGTIKQIQSLNKYDIELYDFARVNFEKTLRQEGLEFKAELLFFKFLNFLYRDTPKIYSLCYRFMYSGGQG